MGFCLFSCLLHGRISLIGEEKMKKIAVIMVLLCLIGCSLFADDFTSCLNLIDKKLSDSTVATVQQFSVNLTDAQKYSLYESKKANGTLPFVLNLLLGCGIGSYVQGDTLGGTISLCADLGGYAIAIGGYLKAVNDVAAGGDSNKAATSAASYMIVGYSVLVANKIFTCIRPFTYASDYNKKLSNALYGGVTSVAMIPTIDKNGQPEVVLMAKVSF
jgi:hypothetical protein